MLIKPRTYSPHLKKLEALSKRLTIDHPKIEYVKEDLAKRRAGYKGEQSLDYHLSFLDEEQFFILHDIRLFDGTHFFQLDTIIFSRKFVIILEIKNFAGTLYFDSDFHQLIRFQDEKKESFPDPILQNDRQRNQLRKWLRKTKHTNLPIETLVVISTPRTILETTPQNEAIYKKVIHSAKLPFFVSSLTQKYERNYLSHKQLLQLSQQMASNHSPATIDVLSKYNIPKEDILKGVICSKCYSLPMERKRGKWVCLKCNATSNHAHLSALEDYSLLIDSTITNKKLRDFLHIPSLSVANKRLSSLKLESSGSNKGRVYFLNSD